MIPMLRSDAGRGKRTCDVLTGRMSAFLKYLENIAITLQKQYHFSEFHPCYQYYYPHDRLEGERLAQLGVAEEAVSRVQLLGKRYLELVVQHYDAMDDPAYIRQLMERGCGRAEASGSRMEGNRTQEIRNSEDDMEDSRLTKLERNWILYDVGNSAFILLVSTIIPIYFNHLASSAGLSEVDYLAYWGYAASISTVIVALIGPVLGTIADTRSFKKPLFAACMLAGVIGCGALAVPLSWTGFLAVFILAKVGYNASLIFYDSMLVDVTTKQRLDRVSSNGYAWGYIGSCIPFVISLCFVLFYRQIGISMRTAITAAFFLNAAWWLLFTIPLLRSYEQKHYIALPKHPLRDSFRRLGQTLLDIRNQKQVFLYLLSFFFFIDGVYTIIEMATAYGSALGLASSQLLLALLVTQIVAFPCALAFSRLSKRYETAKLLKVCILAYTGISLFAVQLEKQWEFWILAVFVGMFQGAIQALARSYFAKIIPADKSGEYFGIYDICGKGASFLGTTLVGVVAQITGAANAGVAMLTVLFLAGFVLFCRAAKATC